MKPKSQPLIKVIANNDQAMIIWKYADVIPDCWGFAIYRKKYGESDMLAEPIGSSVGFDAEPVPEGSFLPTTTWPIQAYQWIDYTVNTGDNVAYRVVPMLHQNNQLNKDETHATPWSDFVTLENDNTKDVSFNRGIIASQFIARRMAALPAAERNKKLDDIIDDPDSEIRAFLGGDLLLMIYKLLDEVIGDETLHLYTSLYELNDKVIIGKLNKMKKRAHIILGNGAYSSTDADPQAVNAALLTHADLTRRIVKSPHFAHHKYMVITKIAGGVETAVKVFTGSTNITHNGLFTQTNNGILIHEPEVAAYYHEQWKILQADNDQTGKGLYGRDLVSYNNKKYYSNDKKIATWFVPVKNQVDMTDATSYIQNAKEGILFLMFKPGGTDKSTLYNEILKRKEDKILIYGVINSDPGGKDNPTITFVNKGEEQEGDFNAAVPAHIAKAWAYWMAEPGQKSVTIHSKLIVIDPFSYNPIVMTGSHNMGEKASASNDDNLNIITGHQAMSVAYALGIFGVYKHYRWRFYRSKAGSPSWNGLQKTDQWQKYYVTGDGKKLVDFWM